ncbi:MAG TPA: hypothetical protein VLU46_00855 [Thermoanaerobaculia bacterium]|nr:hypothetical protein [Thermoanaerobaculia bacterium]
MKKTFVYLAIAAALAACHGGSSDTLQRKDQQQYDVVQEGQTTGVTSTINAPGEVAPPPAPMTGTNADTTSNFTLPQVATPGTQPGQPGTLAGQLPQPAPGSMTSSYPATPPRPRTPPPHTTTTEPQRTDTVLTEPPRHTPPRTDTTGTMPEGPPPSTSTVPPNTDTAPPPPPSTNTTQPPPSTTTT